MLITKDKFRKICIKRLQFCSKQFAINKIVSKQLYDFIIDGGYDNILVYNPLQFEVDINKTIVKLRKKGKKLFLPKMTKNGLDIVPCRLPFIKKRFGVKEAKKSLYYKTKIDLAIVPVIGIDGDFRRIGFGKGFYDRFFGNLNYKPKVLFIQKSLCFATKKITSLYDVKADFILTKEGMIWIR